MQQLYGDDNDEPRMTHIIMRQGQQNSLGIRLLLQYAKRKGKLYGGEGIFFTAPLVGTMFYHCIIPYIEH